MHRRARMLGAVTTVLFASQALAATTPSNTGSATGAEPPVMLFASPVEVKAGKAIAHSECARCHGLDGVSVEENVPNLASQHADYLYAQLNAYKEGTRAHTRMRRSVRILNDESLRQLAAYYSNLELPISRDAEDRARSLEQAEDKVGSEDMTPVEAGKAASASCSPCHGQDGNSALPGMPSLAGQNLLYLVNATKAYREASRKDPMMRPAVALLNDDTIENLALYYALQPPKASPTTAEGDAAKGRSLATPCAECHGEDGNSSKPDTPSLAGQDPKYLAAATLAYKNGTRDHSAMQSLVASLSEGDINDLAAFYASLQPKIGEARKPLTTAQWAERCDRCHGIDGNSIDPGIPSISSQREDYLAKAMLSYRERERGNTIMRAMLRPMKDIEIKNLAAYYSGKRRKAVVFVRVPCAQ